MYLFTLLILSALLPATVLSKDLKMDQTYQATNVSVSINRPVQEVYKFMSDPLNMPKWAAGLAKSSFVKAGDSWVTESPMGKVKVKFAPENEFGVVDHDVTLPSGEVNHNPLRVVKNNLGSEVIFTLLRRPGMSEADFENDRKMVEKDLKTLKSVLE